MIKYTIKYTTQFKKDYKQVQKRGMDINLLKEIVMMIATGKNLPPQYKDHPLNGNWSDNFFLNFFLYRVLYKIPNNNSTNFL